MGRMRVRRRITVLMVTTVHGDPLEHWPLHGHRAKNGPEEFHPCVCLKGTVDEQAVEADRDPQSGKKVHSQQEAEVGPTEPPAPQEKRSSDQAQQRHGDGEKSRCLDHERWLPGIVGLGQRPSRCGGGAYFFRHDESPVRLRAVSGIHLLILVYFSSPTAPSTVAERLIIW